MNITIKNIVKIFSVFLLINSVQAKEFHIAALFWSNTIEGQVAMKYGVEDQVNNINKKGTDKIVLHKYIAGDGYKGISNQIEQMYEAIKKNVDIIIIQPTDNAALVEPLLLANKKNIPVIAYDQYILEGKLLSYITSNNYQAGVLNAEYLISHLNSLDKKKKTPLRIILVEYPHISSTVERVEGFLNTLDKSGVPYKILKSYEAVNPKTGKRAAKQILKEFPSDKMIDVIFTVNDGGGLSIVEALSKKGYKDIFVATVDGDPTSIKNIKESKLTKIDSAQFCSELGRESVKVAYRYLSGEKVPSKILIPTYPITKETYSNFVGWKGRVPASFIKSWNKKEWNNEKVEIWK